MHAQFSVRTLREFADAAAGFFVLRQIDDAFESSGLSYAEPKSIVSGRAGAGCGVTLTMSIKAYLGTSHVSRLHSLQC
jgi:hypothetical protein